MTAVETKLVEKIKRLPPEKLAEVENFVDFIPGNAKRPSIGCWPSRRRWKAPACNR